MILLRPDAKLGCSAEERDAIKNIACCYVVTCTAQIDESHRDVSATMAECGVWRAQALEACTMSNF